MNDRKTTVEELKNLVRKFCEERNWGKFHNVKELAIGISTEAGELLQHFRFKSHGECDRMMKSESREEIVDELSDVLYFVLRLAQLYNIDLSSSLKRKLEKNEKKYPVEKSRGSNKKYNEAH